MTNNSNARVTLWVVDTVLFLANNRHTHSQSECRSKTEATNERLSFLERANPDSENKL